MIIMFITFMILAVMAFKLGVYSVLFGVVKFVFTTVFFLTGGFILYWGWKWIQRKRARDLIRGA